MATKYKILRLASKVNTLHGCDTCKIFFCVRPCILLREDSVAIQLLNDLMITEGKTDQSKDWFSAVRWPFAGGTL